MENKTYEGGFVNTFSNSMAKKESIEKRVIFQFFNNGYLNDFSAKNILYLAKINELCKNNNIKLILINTPLHQYYKKNIPVKFIDKFNQIAFKLNVEVLDLSDLLVDDNCFIPDGDHVSQIGAILTTKHIEKLLHK